jgi:hypothetical protein
MILVFVQKHDQWLSQQNGMLEVFCTYNCKTVVFETIYRFAAVQNLHKTVLQEYGFVTGSVMQS